MRALVTGATGFIGSHVAKRLIDSGAEVRALVRATSDTTYLRKLGAELVVGDLADGSGLDAALRGVDVVHHNAATVGDWGPWEEFARVGIDGTERLLAASVRADVERFVHMSSASVYGFLPIRGKRVREDRPRAARPWRWDYYGRAKSAAEELVAACGEHGAIGTAILRPTVVCGARDRAVFPRVVRLLAEGRLLLIGSGRNRVHVIAADDVAEAALLAGTREEAIGQIYNLDGARDLTQQQFFETIADLAGLPRPNRRLPLAIAFCLAFGVEAWARLSRRDTAPWLTRYWVVLAGGEARFDLSKARRELGWEPRTPVWRALELAHESLS